MAKRTQHTPLSLMEADCLSPCHAEQPGTEGHQEKGPLLPGPVWRLSLTPISESCSCKKGCSPGQGPKRGQGAQVEHAGSGGCGPAGRAVSGCVPRGTGHDCQFCFSREAGNADLSVKPFSSFCLVAGRSRKRRPRPL